MLARETLIELEEKRKELLQKDLQLADLLGYYANTQQHANGRSENKMHALEVSANDLNRFDCWDPSFAANTMWIIHIVRMRTSEQGRHGNHNGNRLHVVQFPVKWCA